MWIRGDNHAEEFSTDGEPVVTVYIVQRNTSSLENAVNGYCATEEVCDLKEGTLFNRDRRRKLPPCSMMNNKFTDILGTRELGRGYAQWTVKD